MLSNSLRILNFDDNVAKQEKLLSNFINKIIDLKDLAPQARIWLDKRIRDQINKRIQDSPKNALTFLGSADFHHISSILIEQFDEPLTVIHFDRHADWNIFPLGLNCGGWVSETLKNKNISKYVLIGMGSRKTSGYSIQTGNFYALRNDRLEIYPYAQVPSKVFLRNIPPNRSVRAKGGPFSTQIHWNELKDKDINEFLLGLLKRLPTKKVYITIDKDCLRKEHSLTNWQEGMFSLDQLLSMLKLIKENLDIVGADIAGDYSEIVSEGILRRIVAFFVHPKEFSAKDIPESKIKGINEETNLKIAETLLS